MKKFTNQRSYWREIKALTFFRNFIQNHNGAVNDNDTFELVAGLKTGAQWVELIKKSFPAKTLDRMLNYQERRDRLDFDDSPKEMIREIWSIEFGRKRLRELLMDVVNAELQTNPLQKFAGEAFGQKVAELKNTLKLSEFEMDILLISAFICDGLLCIAADHNRSSDEYDRAVFFAKNLNCDLFEVMEAVNENSKLRRYRCIDHDLDFNRHLNAFLNGINSEPLSSRYFSLNKDEVLPWDFYGTLAQKHGALLERILASGDGTHPVNILLYGAPGTGKTSFAKTLAARIKRNCYLINSDRYECRDEFCNTTDFRFGTLQICAEQVEPSHSLIVVDEADEMLRGNFSGSFWGGFCDTTSGNKGLLNSVMDSVKVPTIWITNTPAEALDESSRRRFDYSICFEPLSDIQRLSIWKNNVAKLGLNSLISNEMMENFASLYPVSAGGITLVLQNLVKLAPKTEEVEPLIEKLMKPHCELLGISAQHNKMLPAKDYSLDGLNIKGKIPLERIVDAVRNYQKGSSGEIDRPRMNLLLSGAPGTGKTEFVKYLGKTLNTKVIVKMGSDLLNMFVGGTEHKIKQAFAEAEAEHAILFLDEIDGMLQSRENAQRSWEVTQVNELLHQMENFNGVMVGATNFSAHLDPAVMRRFTFKLEFDYLDEVGKRLFFERMFQTKLTTAEERQLANIPNLAPGDFRTVRQSFFYLGGSVTNADRIEALRQESANKRVQQNSSEKKRIGF